MTHTTTPPTGLQTLLAHLATHPTLPAQLRILHSLALYDSGDALLAREEKDALQAICQLAELLELVPSEELLAVLNR